jgi:hypothetical protein
MTVWTKKWRFRMPEPKIAERVEDEVQDYAFLGREFMTWLLFRAARGDATFEDDAGEFGVAFGGRLRLVGPAGDVTDAVLKGRSPGASVELCAALGAGRTVREAELRVSRGDREFRLTLIAETLDLKGVKLPARLLGPHQRWGRERSDHSKDEGDDALGERMALIDELESCIRSAFQAFIKERTRPLWQRSLVPELRAWLAQTLQID